MKGKGFGFSFSRSCQLVGRLVVGLVVVVGVFCSPLSVSVSYAEVPVWRILWAVLPEVDYTHPDGQRIAITMTSKDLEVCERMAKRAEAFLEEATKGAVDFQVVVKKSTQSVTTLTDSDGLWLAERDLPADIVNERKTGDYQLTIATVRLSLEYWGELIAEVGGSTTGTYSFIMLNPFFAMSDYDTDPYPELDWIHELLHGLENYFAHFGYSLADIHYPEYYGFPDLFGPGSYGNEEFYRAFLSGNLYDSSGKQVGITPDMWSLKPNSTPTNPTTPTSPTPASNDGGGGGCDTELPIYALLALLVLRRKRS